MTFSPSPQQQDVFDWISNDSGNAVLEAVAGSGKSTTLVESIKHTEGSVIMCVFSKKPQEDLRKKVTDQRIKVSTFHSIGFESLRNSTENITVNDKKTDEIMKEINTPFDLRPFVRATAGIAKQHGVHTDLFNIDDNDYWDHLVEHYDLRYHLIDKKDKYSKSANRDINGKLKLGVKASKDFLNYSRKSTTVERFGIDFEDMIWLPIAWDMKMNTFDWVMIDECLVSDTPILLDEKGNQKTIKEIVDTKYDGTVLSYDSISKTNVHKKVTGWYKIPVGKKQYKITVQQCGYTKDGSRLSPLTEQVRLGRKFVICTADHKFYSNGKWIEAQNLSIGDPLIVESITPKNYKFHNRYKISTKGRNYLSKLMKDKNEKGLMLSQSVGGFSDRKGNGTGPSQIEQMMLDRLGSDWKWNFIIPTKVKKGNGYPTHYKIDLFNEKLNLALEIDGSSHRSRKDQDIKKENFIKNIGIDFIRLSNAECISITDEVLNEKVFNSPCSAEVVSIEEYIPTEPYVYDIDVEGTHCFYADGVLVHNCQDTNPMRRAISEKLMGDNSRLIAVGDACQPEGTLVSVITKKATRWTPEIINKVPIEELKVGDSVVSYNKSDTSFIKGRLITGITKRPYTGDLIVAETASGLKSKYTPNHICLVNFTDLRHKTAVYLMRRGDQFRIGKCKMNYISSSGLCARMREEKADSVWLLDLYDTEHEAYFMEQAISGKYGIPQLMFNHEKLIRVPAAEYLPKAWDYIGDNYNKGKTCLEDFGRLIEYPFFTKKQTNQQTIKRPVLVRACNLISGAKVIPYRESIHVNKTDWETISVSREKYIGNVISLSVEKEQTYVADGITTHNCQAIFGFTGSDSDALDLIRDKFNTIKLPLTVSFRCPINVVKEAQRYVQHIEYAPNAKEGTVEHLDMEQFNSIDLAPDDVILCRNTKPLIEIIYKLFAKGKKAHIEGKDLGRGLVKFVKHFGNSVSLQDLSERMTSYERDLIAEFNQKGQEDRIEALEDKVECIRFMIQALPSNASVADLIEKIESLFEDNAPTTTLSTIHKAKGREWNRVYWVGRNQYQPSKYAIKPWQRVQENNLMYVAATRSKDYLGIVN